MTCLTFACLVLACDIKNIKRLLVSSRYADKGFYMLKFNKAGKWRYVHIDDRVPCRQSGRVHYSRNENPNETFAMLIEKAYAKLHGCYEALVYGTMEITLRDLTPAANVSTIKCDMIPPEGAYNAIWKVLEQAIESEKTVACGRYVVDPYNDSVELRKGIDLGIPYQVVDVCSAKSMPTENLDAMHVAMVLVRVLQPRGRGLFTGRWSRGHSLWVDYPDIGKDLFVRTQEILMQYNLADVKKPLPRDDPSVASSKKDTDSVSKAGSAASKKTLSTGASATDDSKDSVEGEPVDAFSDVKLQLGLSDGEEEADNMSKERRPKNRKNVVEPDCDFLCWIQFEDFVEVFNRVFILDDISWIPNYSSKRFLSTWVVGDYVAGSGGPPSEYLLQSADDALFGSPRRDRKGSSVTKNSASSASKAAFDSTGLNGVNSKDGDSVGNEESDDESEEDGEDGENADPFTDNPMYPFSVTEPTDISVALFQADKRWSAARVADDPLEICVHDFAVRGGRSLACMQYPNAIGFVVMKLSGLKMRITTFKMKKLAGTSLGMTHTNVTSNFIHLLPGRYAIVPFTHEILQYSTEYTLFAQFKKGAVEFEINDILKERPIDQVLSEDEEDEPALSDLPKSDPVQFSIPSEAPDEPWIWKEDSEEQGILSIYEQVGDLAKQLRQLRSHILVMDHEVRELKLRTTEAEKKAKEREEEDNFKMSIR